MINGRFLKRTARTVALERQGPSGGRLNGRNNSNLPKYLAPNQPYPNDDLIAAVFPILWSFLLQPGEPGDSFSDNTELLDFKTISVLLFVSKTAKETFDACNGRRLCYKALRLEACSLVSIAETTHKRFCWFITRDTLALTNEEMKVLDTALDQLGKTRSLLSNRVAFVVSTQLMVHFAETSNREYIRKMNRKSKILLKLVSIAVTLLELKKRISDLSPPPLADDEMDQM